MLRKIDTHEQSRTSLPRTSHIKVRTNVIVGDAEQRPARGRHEASASAVHFRQAGQVKGGEAGSAAADQARSVRGDGRAPTVVTQHRRLQRKSPFLLNLLSMI